MDNEHQNSSVFRVLDAESGGPQFKVSVRRIDPEEYAP